MVNGTLVWFTGLPSSGKSSLAQRVRERLLEQDRPCCILDSDRVRALLRPAPGYSDADRDAFYQTLGDLAVELAEQGLIVLVPATAHRKVYRDRIRAQCSQFIEVWMTAPLAECRRRDAKSLYARFAAGDVHALPGEDQAYEAPQCPEVTAHGGEDEQAVAQILSRLPEPVPKHTTVTP